jgi:capsid assembly protease
VPAIAPHSSSTTDTAWNAGENERRINTPVQQSAAAHFWAWRQDGDWPTTKSGYKFPHHVVSDGGNPGAANTTACSSIIAILNGARGGADISDTDKKGVYDHVAGHLKAGGKTPPPLGATAEESEAFAAELEAQERAEHAEQGRQRPSGASLPVTAFGNERWAIDRDALPRVMDAQRAVFAEAGAARHIAGELDRQAGPDSYIITAASAITQEPAKGAVAVICLTGLITPRGSILSLLFGGRRGGLTRFREEFNEALDDPSIGAIVLDIDSPGGQVSLVTECAAEIRAARGQKPIIAIANTLCASAAYWIAAQADKVVATPSGRVGSIGVVAIHLDWSSANQQMGVVPTYVTAGKYKAERNEDAPLSENAEAAMQGEVDEIYARFLADVAAGRKTTAGTVEEGYGEGRVLLAAPALKAGLIDQIATIEEVVGGLLGGDQPAPGALSAQGLVALVGSDRALARDLAAALAVSADEDGDEDEEPEDEPSEDDDDEEEDDDEEAEEASDTPLSKGAVLFG